MTDETNELDELDTMDAVDVEMFGTLEVRRTYHLWAQALIAMRVAGVAYHRACSGHYPEITDETAKEYAMEWGLCEVRLDLALMEHVRAKAGTKPDVLQPALTAEQTLTLLRAARLGEEQLTTELASLRFGVVFR